MSGIARIVDLAIAATFAGIERAAVVERVREMEEKGATPDQITDALQAMRQESEKSAQAKVDAAR